MYLYDQYAKHTEFEDYVNARDQYAVCNIPTNIEYSYYANVELVVLVEAIASQSYMYYDQAQSNDSQKYQAMINTLPKAKEVVAGLLYRFAIEKTEQHIHDFKLIYTGNHYHSGNQHYYQYNNKCSTCGYIQNTIWKNYFCPGPPCMPPTSMDV